MSAASLSVVRLVVVSLVLLGTAAPAVASDPAELQARTAILLTPNFDPATVKWSLWEDGRVVFEAFRLAASQRGLYLTGGPGGFATIFESGTSAPGLPGLTLDGPLEWVAVNDAFAFLVFVMGEGVDTTNNFALYAGTLTSGPQLIFRKGDPVPGVPGLSFNGATNLTVDHHGGVLFTTTGVGLFYGLAGDVTTIATPFAPVPGRPGEHYTGILSPVMNENGMVAFVGITNASGRGVWSGPPNALSLRVSVGDPAFGVIDTISFLDTVSLTANSRLAIKGALAISGKTALWSDVLSSGRLVFDTFSLVSRPTASRDGLLAFLVGSGTSLFVFAEQTSVPGLLRILAHWGQQAPGLPAGVEFGDFPGGPVINRFEQVAFPSTLRGAGVVPANDKSIWIHDPDLGTQLVAREGSPIQIGQADVRTIATLVDNLFNGKSLQDGVQRAFNQLGEVAFKATFTDGVTALLVAQRQSPAVVVFSDGFESGDTAAW